MLCGVNHRSRCFLRVGNGLDEGRAIGPVITPQSMTRIESLIDAGTKEGAKLLIEWTEGKDCENTNPATS